MTRASLAALLGTVLLAGISLAGRAGARPAVAPELSGGTQWLNTPREAPLTLAALRGKVVLIEFWTAGCINCLNTLPWVKQWHARHQAAGLVIIGVHSPEFAHEHEEAYVRGRIGKLGIRYPVVMDNAFRIWRAYNTRFWPTMFLIDKAGRIRYTHIGEGNYNVTEATIRRLLSEPAP
ncbi:MAG TPA: redoxin family protein [bacterium]|jgi:thiol-disulfide isomerase/thioredoxin|nr:redoxin family protein [bacterium]